VCARLPIGPLMACETHARLRGNAASCRLRVVLDVVDLCFCNLFVAIASCKISIDNIKITMFEKESYFARINVIYQKLSL